MEQLGETLVEKQLCRNFMLHMASLQDFGLIKAETMYRTVMQLRQIELNMQQPSATKTQSSDDAGVCTDNTAPS